MNEDLRKDLQKAVESVGGYVAAREEKLTELIERTAGKVDERTEHRYRETIDKVKAGLHTGVARLAEQGEPKSGPTPDEPPTAG